MKVLLPDLGTTTWPLFSWKLVLDDHVDDGHKQVEGRDSEREKGD